MDVFRERMDVSRGMLKLLFVEDFCCQSLVSCC